MRLRTSIFLWAVPCAVLPLTLLVLATNEHAEKRYLREVEERLQDDLQRTTQQVERRLRIERDIASNLLRVPAVRRFLPHLFDLDAKVGDSLARDNLEVFIESFQRVRTSLDTVRILDPAGNTVLKVQRGQRRSAQLETLEGRLLVEEVVDNQALLSDLRTVSEQGIGSAPLPQNEQPLPSVFATVVPLRSGGNLAGFIAVNPPLGAINRLLDIAPRPYKGNLLVAEINADDPDRHGLILYQDTSGHRLFDQAAAGTRLGDVYPTLADSIFHQGTGRITDRGSGRYIYFREFRPYPDRLLSWVITLSVEPSALGAPFQRVRDMVYAGLGLALVFSLILVQMGSRRIAQPVTRLSKSLCGFAKGERDPRLDPIGPDELQNAAKAFNQMADELDRTQRAHDEAQLARHRNAKLASMGHMAGGIAHEISNPLNTILSLVRLVERDLPASAEAARSDIASIREETERASRTVQAILKFSHQIGGEMSRMALADLVDDSIALVRAQAEARGQLIAPQEMDRTELEGEPELLRHVLRNLLENAIQVSPEGSTITIDSKVDESLDQLRLTVRDSGPGIPSEALDKVFDPFFTTKPEGQGSGLGLSIALGIVQYHGGILELNNAAQGGAEARITLPLKQPSIRS